MSHGVPRRRELVLLGGGHSHVQVLRGLLMKPRPDARVTVVVDRADAVYSGMVPGLVAGEYDPEQLTIDVRPLARRANAAVVLAVAERVDPSARRVHLVGRPPIAYDVLSINTGATVRGLELPGVPAHALATRPIGRFAAAFPPAARRFAGRSARVVVVGAGAAGVELAFCARERLLREGATSVDVHLLLGDAGLLPGRSRRLQARVRAEAAARGIGFVTGRAAAVHADRVELSDGADLPADLVLWATGSIGWELGRSSGLPVDERGFIQVEPTLQVVGQPDVFAVGDAAVLTTWPDIPKAGVYAVREGPYLAENLRRRLDQLTDERAAEARSPTRPLRPYRPQRDFLALLNLGDGTAIADKWGLALGGRLAMRWKDRIDRRFMERFQVLAPDGRKAGPFERGVPAMADGAMGPMVCGGCAAKVGEGPLLRALDRLGKGPRGVAVGGRGDDAVILQLGGSRIAASVDSFSAFVDDPYLVGRVAAHNALSDLLAQGVRPQAVLALVQVAWDCDEEEALFQVLAGARTALDEAGVELAGGHSTVGPRMTVGFAALGAVQDEPWSHDGARIGDSIVLARALGTGVILNADMAGEARSAWVEPALSGMLRGNLRAFEALRPLSLRCVTDVTGFGLGGHLGELMRESGTTAKVDLAAIPALPGSLELLAAGHRSTLHEANRQAGKAMALPGSSPRVELLFDPQTAGGLLACVPAGQVERVLDVLRAAGEQPVAIAEVVERAPSGAVIDAL